MLKKKGGKGKNLQGRRNDKKAAKAAKLMSMLWIAPGCELQLHETCSFCENRSAVLHCPTCEADGDGDSMGMYLCEECDLEMHKHKKRMDHVRTVVPNVKPEARGDEPAGLTPAAAQHRITGLFRTQSARAILIAKCRKVVERYYDPKTRMYYYYNKTLGTISWQLPICLRRQILKPLPSFDECALRIQGLVRCRQARMLLVEMIVAIYDKIFSREFTRFYYFYNGQSPHLDKVRWTRPHWLFHRDLRPVLTEDVCALLIQGCWYTYNSKKFLRLIVRQKFKRGRDPLSGKVFYTNLVTGLVTWDPPLVLGGDRWDPDDMTLWSSYEVGVWLRRMGYGRSNTGSTNYAKEFVRLHVDGATLLTFEWEDYMAIGVTQSHHVKKILLEIEKKAFFATYRDSPAGLAKRDRLRYHYKLEAAAVSIQRKYRGRYGQMMMTRFREAARLAHEHAKRKKELEAGALWWNKKMHMVELPTAKKFGRHRPVKGTEGWGEWEGGAVRGMKPRYRRVADELQGHVVGYGDLKAWTELEGKPRPLASCDDSHATLGQVAMLEKQIPRINPDTRNLLFKLNAIDVEGEGGGAGGGNGGRNKTR